MVENVTIENICQLFDGFKVDYKNEDDNQILFTLNANKNFPHDLQVRIVIDNQWMKVYAIPDDFNISIGDSADYLLAVNHYNTWKCGGKASLMIIKEINMITLKMETIFYLSGPVSVDYIVEGCIKYSIGEIREFFNTIDDCKAEVLK